jgi:hypothetical protein
MISILKEQADSAARYRRAHGLDKVVPPQPPGEDDVVTAPFFSGIQLRSLWVPAAPDYHPLFKELLAVIAASAAPGLAERCGLQPGELYKDPASPTEEPSVVLGQSVVICQEPIQYRAAPTYKIAEIAIWTRRLSRQRAARDLAQMQRDAAEAERAEILRREGERQRLVKATRAAEEEAARRGNVFARITELEKKVADQDRVARAEAECRLRELERRLGEPPPPPPT